MSTGSNHDDQSAATGDLVVVQAGCWTGSTGVVKSYIDGADPVVGVLLDGETKVMWFRPEQLRGDQGVALGYGWTDA